MTGDLPVIVVTYDDLVVLFGEAASRGDHEHADAIAAVLLATNDSEDQGA